MKRAVVFLGSILISGCSSITGDSTQSIAIDSVPSGAVCTLTGGGVKILTITTPSIVVVPISKRDIDLQFSSEGYLPASAIISSNKRPITGLRMISDGALGIAIDSATGADRFYESIAIVKMVPAKP